MFGVWSGGELKLMKRYEYKVMTVTQFSKEAQEKALNELGSQGWKLVAELDDNSPTHSLVFEREIPG